MCAASPITRSATGDPGNGRPFPDSLHRLGRRQAVPGRDRHPEVRPPERELLIHRKHKSSLTKLKGKEFAGPWRRGEHEASHGWTRRPVHRHAGRMSARSCGRGTAHPFRTSSSLGETAPTRKIRLGKTSCPCKFSLATRVRSGRLRRPAAFHEREVTAALQAPSQGCGRPWYGACSGGWQAGRRIGPSGVWGPTTPAGAGESCCRGSGRGVITLVPRALHPGAGADGSARLRSIRRWRTHPPQSCDLT